MVGPQNRVQSEAEMEVPMKRRSSSKRSRGRLFGNWLVMVGSCFFNKARGTESEQVLVLVKLEMRERESERVNGYVGVGYVYCCSEEGTIQGLKL